MPTPTNSDGPRGLLETKLASVLAEIERRAEADWIRDEERRQADLERAAEHERQLERERLEERERRRGEALLATVDAWRRADDGRRFVALVRGRLADLDAAWTERLAAWCEWADCWAKENDPASNIERLLAMIRQDQPDLPGQSQDR